MNGGLLFEADEKNIMFLIRQNYHLIEFNYPIIIGKLLFWSWIHLGSWPQWLDPIHLQYIIDEKESISCMSSLLDYAPYFYNLSNDIKNNGKEIRKRDLEFWIEQRGLNVSLFYF